MTRTSSSPRARPPAPWWLGGDEECPQCGQGYAFEAEYRCIACDGPLCPLCVVEREAGVHCRDCVDEREDPP
jgi:hypothetical protein